MRKFTFYLKMPIFLMICLIFTAFSLYDVSDEYTSFIQKMLTDHYDEAPGSLTIKRHELNVTNSGFCRYKRYFKSGKVEYFSFNLTKFKEMDYYGTNKNGQLYLRTNGDDVIVQTYNDRKEGDVDTMAAYLAIPLKDIAPEDLNGLSERLVKMNAHLLAQK